MQYINTYHLEQIVQQTSIITALKVNVLRSSDFLFDLSMMSDPCLQFQKTLYFELPKYKASPILFYIFL